MERSDEGSVEKRSENSREDLDQAYYNRITFIPTRVSAGRDLPGVPWRLPVIARRCRTASPPLTSTALAEVGARDAGGGGGDGGERAPATHRLLVPGTLSRTPARVPPLTRTIMSLAGFCSKVTLLCECWGYCHRPRAPEAGRGGGAGAVRTTSVRSTAVPRRLE